MPVKTEDRPLETVREEVIDQLIMNYSHGELSIEAFERRLDEAMASKDQLQLKSLVADLELEADDDYTASKRQSFGANMDYGQGEELDYLVSIFGGNSRSGAWSVAKEVRAVSIFSGNDVDLSEARFTHPVTKIRLLSLCAGNDIYVPENVNVVSRAFCIFGGIDNSASTLYDSNAPTVIIEGLAVFSGVDIKVKRTIKEKFVEFAEGLKRLFS